MKKPNNQPASNFWFGFAVGTLTATTAAYLLATTKGRKDLKKLLDFTENLDENLHTLSEELGERKDEAIEQIQKVTAHSSLHSLLDKMKIFSPENDSKHTKKLFVKEQKNP